MMYEERTCLRDNAVSKQEEANRQMHEHNSCGSKSPVQHRHRHQQLVRDTQRDVSQVGRGNNQLHH